MAIKMYQCREETPPAKAEEVSSDKPCLRLLLPPASLSTAQALEQPCTCLRPGQAMQLRAGEERPLFPKTCNIHPLSPPPSPPPTSTAPGPVLLGCHGPVAVSEEGWFPGGSRSLSEATI